MEKYYLRVFEVDITDKCNLKCASCLHFSPLTTEPFFYSEDVFESDIKRMSELFNCSEIRLLGGEPLLHDKLKNLIDIVYKYFPKVKLLIMSNGILKDKLDEIKKYCHEIGIKSDVKPSNYPLSNVLGDGSKNEFRFPNINLNGNSNIEISRILCNNKNYFSLYNGMLYICPVMRNFDKFNNFFKLNIDIPETDRAINIHTHSSSEVFLFIHGFNQGLKVCRYCNTTHPAIAWHRTNYELSEYVSK